MFGDSLQNVISAVSFPRSQLACTSGEIKIERAFVLGKVCIAPMNMITVLLVACLRKKIFQALTTLVDRTFTWTNSIDLQLLNSNNKHPIFIANKVSEIKEVTSLDQHNHVVICDILADAGTFGMSAQTLQSVSCVRCLNFLRTKQCHFRAKYYVIDSIKAGVVTKQQNDDSISFLVTFATKPVTEQSVQLITFDNFISDQKLSRVMAYMIRLVELYDVERHLQYRRKDLVDNKSDKKSYRIAQFTPFLELHDLVCSDGQFRPLLEVDFDI